MRKLVLPLLLIALPALAQTTSAFHGAGWYYITGSRILGGPYPSLADCRSHADNGGACSWLDRDPGPSPGQSSGGTPG
jgi:hypothetical protein